MTCLLGDPYQREVCQLIPYNYRCIINDIKVVIHCCCHNVLYNYSQIYIIGQIGSNFMEKNFIHRVLFTAVGTIPFHYLEG